MPAEVGIKSILMTTDTVGGVWSYSITLARALRRLGIEVTLATMGAPLSPGQRRESASFRVFESEYRLEWMDDPWDDVAPAGQWLRDIEARICPDVVHLNGYAHASLAWAAPVLVVAHSCVLSWWRAVKGDAVPEQWGRYRDEVRRGLGNATKVIAPSRAMLNALQKFYDVSFDGAVILNACDSALYAPDSKEPIIFSAGRLWDEAKNIRLLDSIAKDLAWPVYVAGEHRHPNGQVTATHGVHLLGCLPAEEVRQWYARAAIYVLPAKYEPFGLSILEAALSGCALVLGDIASLRENWDGAAVFVDPDDARGLRRAIEKLIADQAIQQEMGARARQRGLTFSTERMGNSYLAAYTQLARVAACA